MKPFLSLFALLLTLYVQAQVSEKFYNYNWKETVVPGEIRFYSRIEKKDSLWLQEDYFVQKRTLQMKGSYLDSSGRIPHGEFFWFHANGNLQSTGTYINGKSVGRYLRFYDDGNLKDSLYYREGELYGTSFSFHRNGFLSDSMVFQEDGTGIAVGWFDNGQPSYAGFYAPGRKPEGKWQFFHRNGQKSSIEIYRNGEVVDKTLFDEEGRQLADTTSRDRDAEFPGGISGWKSYLAKKLFFPENYQITGSELAVVVVDWEISEEGNVENVVVSTPFHPDFDRIAKQAIMRSPKWQPATIHNRKVRVFRRQPVSFVQQ